jgi:hypothetical protein
MDENESGCGGMALKREEGACRKIRQVKNKKKLLTIRATHHKILD